jgi:hypothetical protein
MSKAADSAAFIRKATFALVALFLVGVGHRCSSGRLSFSNAVSEPKRDQEFPARFAASNAVPPPLEGCDDAVGGIESITIAGKRYWFGFAYSVDLVVSPLIDDPRVMAQFGSDHMLQRDGAHPPDYWQRQVSAAVEVSELSSDPGDRDFTGSEARSALQEIEDARNERRPAKVLLPYHLTYLLHATTASASAAEPQACSSDAGQAIRRLDNYEDCLSAALKIVSGAASPPANTDYDDALEVVSEYLQYYRRTVPENWRSLLLAP